MACNEGLHTAYAGSVGGDLGPEVARRLVLGANLRQDQPEDVLDDGAALDDLDGRDDHTLLEHLAERADARGGTATDIDVVGEVRHVAEQLAVGVNGRDQADVVQVDATRIRVVGDDHVARAEVLRAVVANGARHLLDHRAEVHWLRESLRHRP